MRVHIILPTLRTMLSFLSDKRGFDLSASFHDVDNDTAAYLSHVLTWLRPHPVHRIRLSFDRSWTVSSQACDALDEALSTLNAQHSNVMVGVEWSFFVLTRRSSSQTCMDGFTREVLPRCAELGLLVPCRDYECGVHGPVSYPGVHVQGTLQQLLDVLPKWTSQLSDGRITIQSTLLESLGALSEETRRVWEEISRICRLCHVCVHVEDVGVLEVRLYSGGVLSINKSMCRTSYSRSNFSFTALVAELHDADDKTLAYLSHILPCLPKHYFPSIDIRIGNGWSASKPVWHTLDKAILTLSPSRVEIGLAEGAVVPPWKILPYECRNDLLKDLLPECARYTTYDQLSSCINEGCRLHDLSR